MTTDWKEISSDTAWELCEAHGASAPYCGYLRQLPSGVSIRCVRRDGRTIFEIKAAGGTVAPFPKGRWT